MIFTRLGDKKQTRRQNMAAIVCVCVCVCGGGGGEGGGGSEIKCIIFKNNDNSY
jgi:hypothetical protein